MTQEELLAKIKEFEDTLTPEEHLKWLQELNEKIKETNEDVKGLLGVLQTAKEEKDIEKLKAKMQGNAS
jgi:exonuclease I